MRAGRLAAIAAVCGALATPALCDPAGSAGRGSQIFDDSCSFCHVLGGGGQGPNLQGVVGRKAGRLPGYDYTDALKSSGLTWTAATLDRFLAGPAQLVPGTAMQASLPDAAARADLIAYLASLSAGR